MAETPQLTLYSRLYCHLCDDMIGAVKLMRARFKFHLVVVDVDADEALIALYDELVPVLIGAIGDDASVQLCHYFLDETVVGNFLASCQYN